MPGVCHYPLFFGKKDEVKFVVTSSELLFG